MGRYQKKPYKKQSIDPLYKINIQQEYAYDINKLGKYENLDDDLFDQYEVTSMIEEPEIVQQLRKEEREGLLPLWFPEYPNEEIVDIFSSDIDTLPKIDIRSKRSYEESYRIAKNSLQKLASKNQESIQFE